MTHIFHSYTRKEALEDGFQVDANIGDFAEVSRQHYKYPVFMTKAVFDLMERAVENPRWRDDFKGVSYSEFLDKCIEIVQGVQE